MINACPLGLAMTTVDLFNLFEVYLWAVMGTGFLVAAAFRKPQRIRCAVAGITFLMFAGSDYVELSTGAWWRPWWLFVWKATCVLTLLFLGYQSHRESKSEAVATHPDESAPDEDDSPE